MGIFNEEELAAAAQTEVTEPKPEEQGGEQQPQGQDDRPRDEQGRFAPKTAEEGKQEPAPGKDPGERTVEHGALHSERERRKSAEAQLKEAQDTLKRLAELRAKIGQGQDQGQQPPAPVGQQPQEETVEQLRARLGRLEQVETRRAQATDHARIDNYEQQQLARTLVTSEAEFAAHTPDYQEATAHLATSRARELQLYGMDPMSIQQTLAEEALEITRTAVQQGRSPAELAYEIAKMRGYQPKPGQQGGNGNGAGNGSAVAMIQAIRKGQETSKSLGSGGSAGGAGDINAQALASMSEDEFDQLYSTPEGRRLINSLS